jgi:hypothetical protein
MCHLHVSCRDYVEKSGWLIAVSSFQWAHTTPAKTECQFKTFKKHVTQKKEGSVNLLHLQLPNLAYAESET